MGTRAMMRSIILAFCLASSTTAVSTCTKYMANGASWATQGTSESCSREFCTRSIMSMAGMNIVKQGCALNGQEEQLCTLYGNAQSDTGCRDPNTKSVYHCKKEDFGTYSGSPTAMKSLYANAPTCQRGSAPAPSGPPPPPPPPPAKYINFVLSLAGLKEALFNSAAQTK